MDMDYCDEVITLFDNKGDNLEIGTNKSRKVDRKNDVPNDANILTDNVIATRSSKGKGKGKRSKGNYCKI